MLQIFIFQLIQQSTSIFTLKSFPFNQTRILSKYLLSYPFSLHIVVFVSEYYILEIISTSWGSAAPSLGSDEPSSVELHHLALRFSFFGVIF